MSDVLSDIRTDVKGLLGMGGSKTIATGKEPVAPVPDDLAAQKKRQKDVARKYSKAGRAGTMLSSDDDKLG